MKLAEVSIKRPVFATMMIAALMVLGIFSYPKVGVDLFPNVEFPFVSVTAIYPGADPEVVEDKVVDKLEEAISTVNGIKSLRSISVENVGQLFVEFNLDVDPDQAAQDVRDKIAAVKRNLPKEMEDPVVAKFDVGAMPILSITLSGKLPIGRMTQLAKDTKERLQKLQGVGGIDIVGGQEREIQILVNRSRLSALSLSVDDITRALQMNNLDVPAGRMQRGSVEYTVKTKGEVSTLSELRHIVVRKIMGRTIRIGDVADVLDTVEEARSYSDLNGANAVALVVKKKSGANTVAVAALVRQEMDAAKKTLPKGVTAIIPVDNSQFIANSMHEVQFDLLFGGILAILIVFFFLADWRATLIVALAIPTSVVTTVAFIHFMGFTFNNMTMLALSLSIGILVDDAIVVIENIHRHMTEEGKPPMQAASEGTAEIGLAVLAATFSIIAVFVPVATMEGIIGKFFYEFGLTVAFAVAASLFVSFTLTPMLSSRFLKVHKGKPNVIRRAFLWVLDRIDSTYAGLLRVALRVRWLVILIALGVLGSSFMALAALDTEFFPEDNRGQFRVFVELPQGKTLAATRALCDEVATNIRRLDVVKDTLITIGGDTQEKVHEGRIQVNLVGRSKRTLTQKQVQEHVRRMLAGERRAKISVQPLGMIEGGQAQQVIQFMLRGSDLKKLSSAADKMLAALKKEKGFVDLDISYRGGKPEIRVVPNRRRAEDRNVPLALIGSSLRMLVGGDKVSDFKDGSERYDIRIRLREQDRRYRSDIGLLSVRDLRGGLVRLRDLVRVERGEGPGRIDRSNRQRQITILANLEGIKLGAAQKKVEALAKMHVPKGVQSSWEGQAKMMGESFGHVLVALLLAIIFVYMILASQFNSFIHPLTIMLSLPFSFIGAFGALLVTGLTMNIFTSIGLILLMGLVTKTAILLVDYTNTLRDRGLSLNEALVQSGRTRLRPILMTTMATIFGMMPVALALSEGGEQRAPMAVAVIGGLITSTMLTLVVVPVVYSLLDRFTLGRQAEQQPTQTTPETTPET
jgi:hydrophobic/amphiphilic exporter-1 (mainly G- bacteria), HAE1 family